MEAKELVVKKPPEFKPQYGGKTLVEKVTAYRLSDGALVEDKEKAWKQQKFLDKYERIRLLLKEYLRPYMAVPVDEDGTTLTIKQEVVSLYDVQDLLYYADEIEIK